MPSEQEQLDEHKHDWQEGYYGWECKCGEMVPYGCEPWMPTDDELHDMLLASNFRKIKEV